METEYAHVYPFRSKPKERREDYSFTVLVRYSADSWNSEIVICSSHPRGQELEEAIAKGLLEYHK